MKVVDLEDKRKEKASHCEFCGKDSHQESLMCPRIIGVVYHEDAVEIIFRSDWDPPLAG